MSTFAYEIAGVLAHQERARPGDAAGPYALPWYLVVGEPESGRTTAIKRMNVHWPAGDEPLSIQAPQQMCTYWMPRGAVIIEPEAPVMGPQRNRTLLRELCAELAHRRPREPIDALLLIVSCRTLADGGEHEAREHARALRAYVAEVTGYLAADVPIYVVATGYDALWGFGDAFQWTAERKDEEPWGFTLPIDLAVADGHDRIKIEIEGLMARIESVCFGKLSTEEPPPTRARAFQHLLEARALEAKLAAFFDRFTTANAFERTPWVRALVLGSALPGSGQALRCLGAELARLGLTLPAHSGTERPGGLPIYAMMDYVILPERDLVPLRTRWRDDRAFIWTAILGCLLWLAAVAAAVIRTLVG
ncbi:MAG: hypothetical protein HY794_14890 [Desulfarculus sp.]|nr:hypothetical protein [Deltaproteobacteria bacterium]MBI4799979.1 hypothetical protein [Desulfarculus sp.]